ncbi:MAG: PilZ domain-containing protein [Acidimicrobiales bacterium]
MPGNRRLGERVEILPVAIAWTPAIAKQRPGRRAQPQPARLVEVSISGARIMARSRAGIEVGTWMTLDIESYHALVEVRRIVEADDGTGFTFGVSFVLLAPALQRKIGRTVAQRRTRVGYNDPSPTW